MHKFIKEISDGVRDAIDTAIELGYKCAYYDHFTECGQISVTEDEYGNISVSVFDDAGCEKTCQNIKRAVMESAPVWSDVENEMYQQNGFNV